MMRLRCCAFVIGALSLLTSATTAYADCAWVLWREASLSPGESYWGLFAVYSLEDGGRAACEQSADRARARETEQEKRMGRNYFCLPDTVDPRGPKGK